MQAVSGIFLFGFHPIPPPWAVQKFGIHRVSKYGRGVAQDHKEAAEWYRKAAEQGDVYGQTNLGYMYEIGREVGQDYEEAIEWFTKAAEQGYASAQYNLGIYRCLMTVSLHANW